MASKCALEAVLITRAAAMSPHRGSVSLLGLRVCPPMGATQECLLSLGYESSPD